MCLGLGCVVFFFFKQKTADEMRISDWSSDVCPSDLRETAGQAADFRSLHGPSASSMAFRVADPKAAYDHAIKEGATPVDAGRGILGDDACAIEGIGGSYLYLVQAGADLYADRSEEHTSELQSLMRISYAVFCLKKKNKQTTRA